MSIFYSFFKWTNKLISLSFLIIFFFPLYASGILSPTGIVLIRTGQKVEYRVMNKTPCANLSKIFSGEHPKKEKQLFLKIFEAACYGLGGDSLFPFQYKKPFEVLSVLNPKENQSLGAKNSVAAIFRMAPEHRIFGVIHYRDLSSSTLNTVKSLLSPDGHRISALMAEASSVNKRDLKKSVIKGGVSVLPVREAAFINAPVSDIDQEAISRKNVFNLWHGFHNNTSLADFWSGIDVSVEAVRKLSRNSYTNSYAKSDKANQLAWLQLICSQEGDYLGISQKITKKDPLLREYFRKWSSAKSSKKIEDYQLKRTSSVKSRPSPKQRIIERRRNKG
jgi:hypothetical protein